MSLVQRLYSHDKHERYEELKYKKCCHQKGLSRKMQLLTLERIESEKNIERRKGNNEILFYIF